MRGISGWNYRPYTLLNAPEERRELFVCRIAPQTAGFTFDYVDTRAGRAQGMLSSPGCGAVGRSALCLRKRMRSGP